jgi:phytanoyl-CoA hydroxylase
MISISGSNGEPLPEDFIPVPVKAGSLVLIHGLVHHRSGQNNSDKSRWIYTFHIIEGTYPYPSDNWYNYFI